MSRPLGPGPFPAPGADARGQGSRGGRRFRPSTSILRFEGDSFRFGGLAWGAPFAPGLSVLGGGGGGCRSLRLDGGLATPMPNLILAAIVASLHGHSGKTLLARVMVDYFVLSGQKPYIFDTDPAERALYRLFPQETCLLDLGLV